MKVYGCAWELLTRAPEDAGVWAWQLLGSCLNDAVDP